jgi:hypothetical protein
VSARKSRPAVWRDAIRDSDLPASVKLVAHTLTTFMSARGWCNPGRETIAEGASTSVRTVERAVARLEGEGWLRVEHGLLNVRRTVSAGEVVELAKTSASRRQVPLSPRALAALDRLPARLDTPRLFPAPSGGLLDLDNFRRREWRPAIEASGVATPARIYDLRSTFASHALAGGITVFELARVMGTSVRMIEKHYGTLVEGAGASIARRLGAIEAAQESAAEQGTGRLGH